MITIQNLHKIYRSGGKAIRALKGIDLEISTGMFGLLGPNGAGKTTLMRILAGIVQSSHGTVIIDGHAMNSEAGRIRVKSMLGYLPQELGMYPDLTARQFIDYMGLLKGMKDTRLRKAKVNEVIEMVGLTEAANRKIKEFSGGMKRRVGIAQALVNDPKLLIVDEPTAGLDPEERIRFRNLLVSLAVNRVVILSTHIVDDIGQTCQSMAVLDRGNIRFHGSPSELTHKANGHVWSTLVSDGSKPNHDLTVVSSLHLPEGVQYRLVGNAPVDSPYTFEPLTPSLEDGYVWLMKQGE